jgi:DNA-binding MarR family transcriptional regulator
MSEATTDPTRGNTKVKAATRRRIGRAWREIRRGAAASRIKDLFYGMGPDGIDMALADALSVLVQNGPMRMGELAEALRITPATATRAVDCLVERDLAERVKAVDDLRSILVSATAAGESRYDILAARINTGLDQILGQFDEAEQTQLADLLERFVAAVDHYVVNEDTTSDQT